MTLKRVSKGLGLFRTIAAYDTECFGILACGDVVVVINEVSSGTWDRQALVITRFGVGYCAAPALRDA